MHVLDIDQAAEEIRRRREFLLRSGFCVGALTFRDQSREWPDMFVEGREHALQPDSVGVTLQRRKVDAWVVLYAAGWVDSEWANFAEPDFSIQSMSARKVLNATAFGDLLDELIDQIRASSERWRGDDSTSGS